MVKDKWDIYLYTYTVLAHGTKVGRSKDAIAQANGELRYISKVIRTLN